MVVKHAQLACGGSEFGPITQQREHVAGQVLGCGDALQDEGVDLLVEHRGARRLVCSGKADFGVLQIGLRRVVLPDRGERRGGVEAAADERDCGGDGYGGTGRGGVEPSGSFAIGCAETDGGEEGEDDDEVGEDSAGFVPVPAL